MNEQGINLRQKRDFGDLLSVTFEFLKENFKPLFRLLLIYVGPFLLVSAILGATIQANNFQTIISRDFNSLHEIFDYKYLLLIIVSVVSNVFLVGAVYGYIALYYKHGSNDFEIEDVWENMKENFWMLLGTTIVSGIIAGFATLFFIIPGIYVGVCLSIILAMRVIEQNPLGDAISRCFTLVKSDWWLTFGIIIVVYIIVSMLSFVFVIPQLIITALVSFSSIQGTDADYGIAYKIVTTITTFCTSFLSAIPMITLAFHYFNLVEKKENPGLTYRIQEINQDSSENEEDSTIKF